MSKIARAINEMALKYDAAMATGQWPSIPAWMQQSQQKPITSKSTHGKIKIIDKEMFLL